MASTRLKKFTFVFSSLSLKEKEAVLEKLELKCQEEGYHLHLGLKAQFFKSPPPGFPGLWNRIHFVWIRIQLFSQCLSGSSCFFNADRPVDAFSMWTQPKKKLPVKTKLPYEEFAVVEKNEME